MATAKNIRAAMIRCAEAAMQDCPDHITSRAQCFVARLSGALEVIGGEAALEIALWNVMSTRPRNAISTDGA